MPWQDPTRIVDWDTAQRILRTGMVISFLVAALGVVGELLGWWNEIGELLMTTGTVGGLVLGATSIIGNASRTQVEAVAGGVAQANQQLGKLDTIDDRLHTLDEIEAGLGMLDKLDTLDAIDSDLDKVHVQLDQQTGVLDQQVGRLTQIRDRL